MIFKPAPETFRRKDCHILKRFIHVSVQLCLIGKRIRKEKNIQIMLIETKRDVENEARVENEQTMMYNEKENPVRRLQKGVYNRNRKTAKRTTIFSE